MPFVTLLNALDELLFEVMSWLIFWPLTLWRAIFRPTALMAEAEAELAKPADAERFATVLSPPLFLLVTLVIAHLAELALAPDNPLIGSNHGLARLVKDDTSLILLRLLLFSLFPIVLATYAVKVSGHHIKRSTLKRAFFSQCYPASTFALLTGIGGLLLSNRWQLTGLAVLLGAVILLLVIETRWFAVNLRKGWVKGTLHASAAMVLALAAAISAMRLFV